jgi:glycosyltransferase involved in cell wall biosynthesis
MQAGRSSSGKLRVLIAPTIPWAPSWRAFRPGATPDPTEIWTLLRHHYRIESDLVDPFSWPWNPLARHHPMLQGLDPLRSLRVLLKSRAYDLLLAFSESPALLPLLVNRWVGSRIKVAVCDPGVTQSWKLRERVLDLVIPRLDAIFVLGANQKDYIEGRWPTAARIEVVHYHADTTFFLPEAPAPNGPILSVGDDEARDFASLAVALRGLDVPVVLKTRRGVPEAESAANIKFVRQKLSAVELRALYAGSRFVVVPLANAIHASGVNTVVEAMAMGKAVIVSDSPGIRDYVRPDETCLTVPCGDVGALRRAIDRLVAEPATCDRLGANARHYVEAKLSHAVYAGNFAAALRRVATRS